MPNIYRKSIEIDSKWLVNLDVRLCWLINWQYNGLFWQEDGIQRRMGDTHGVTATLGNKATLLATVFKVLSGHVLLAKNITEEAPSKFHSEFLLFCLYWHISSRNSAVLLQKMTVGHIMKH